MEIDSLKDAHRGPAEVAGGRRPIAAEELRDARIAVAGSDILEDPADDGGLALVDGVAHRAGRVADVGGAAGLVPRDEALLGTPSLRVTLALGDLPALLLADEALNGRDDRARAVGGDLLTRARLVDLDARVLDLEDRLLREGCIARS